MATGTNLSLQFFPASWQGEQRQTPSREYVDLEREAGKVGNISLQFKNDRVKVFSFLDWNI